MRINNKLDAVKISVFITTNIIGAFFVVGFFGGVLHLIKIQQQNCCNGGDIISLAFRVIPVFLICVFLNIIWVIKISIDSFKHKALAQSLWILFFILIIWVIVFLIIRFGVLLWIVEI